MTFPSKTKKEKTNKQNKTNTNNNTKIGTVPPSYIFVLSSRCPSFNFRHKSGDQSRKSDSLTITRASRKNVPRKNFFLKKKSDKRNYIVSLGISETPKLNCLGPLRPGSWWGSKSEVQGDLPRLTFAFFPPPRSQGAFLENPGILYINAGLDCYCVHYDRVFSSFGDNRS